jgi:hypothetical protein
VGLSNVVQAWTWSHGTWVNGPTVVRSESNGDVRKVDLQIFNLKQYSYFIILQIVTDSLSSLVGRVLAKLITSRHLRWFICRTFSWPQSRSTGWSPRWC